MATTTVTAKGRGAWIKGPWIIGPWITGPWVKIAFAMFAVGWGANQFSPMLIVYRHELGLSAGAVAGRFAGFDPTVLTGPRPRGSRPAPCVLRRTPPSPVPVRATRPSPPAAVRTGRFWLAVAPAAPLVFGSVSLAIV